MSAIMMSTSVISAFKERGSEYHPGAWKHAWPKRTK